MNLTQVCWNPKTKWPLFVNYSCNSFYAFLLPKYILWMKGFVLKYDFIWGLNMDIPLTNIHTSCPTIFILKLIELHWCLLNLLVTSNYQLFFYNVSQHKITIVLWQTQVVQAFLHMIHQVKSTSTISLIAKLQESLESNFAQFLTLNLSKTYQCG